MDTIRTFFIDQLHYVLKCMCLCIFLRGQLCADYSTKMISFPLFFFSVIVSWCIMGQVL